MVQSVLPCVVVQAEFPPSSTAALQIEDIWLVMCPPTPPCGLSLICSQPGKEAERSKERGKECEVWCVNTAEHASKLIFRNEFKASSKEGMQRVEKRERERERRGSVINIWFLIPTRATTLA